jgi:hypothetical protein
MGLPDLGMRIVDGMRYVDKRVDALLGPVGMFGTNKSAAVVVNESIRQACLKRGCKAGAMVQPAEEYDKIGTVTLAAQMFHAHEIVVHQSCVQAARQFSSWRVEQGKPMDTGFEFCEALCLLVSAVNRWAPRKPKAPKVHAHDPSYKPRKSKQSLREKLNSYQIA